MLSSAQLKTQGFRHLGYETVAHVFVLCRVKTTKDFDDEVQFTFIDNELIKQVRQLFLIFQVSIGSLISKRFFQISTLSNFSPIFFSKFLVANQSSGFKVKFPTPANHKPERDLEGKLIFLSKF